MNKTVIIIIAAIIVIGGGIFAFTMKKDKTDTTSTTQSTTPSTMPTMETPAGNPVSDSPAPQAPASTNSVKIENFAFGPADVTVKKGTTVTWTNSDSVTHNVTESDGKTGPKSGDLASGKTYTFIYNEVGTFKYSCTIHPSMVGTVTVTE